MVLTVRARLPQRGPLGVQVSVCPGWSGDEKRRLQVPINGLKPNGLKRNCNSQREGERERERWSWKGGGRDRKRK